MTECASFVATCFTSGRKWSFRCVRDPSSPNGFCDIVVRLREDDSGFYIELLMSVDQTAAGDRIYDIRSPPYVIELLVKQLCRGACPIGHWSCDGIPIGYSMGTPAEI